MKSNSINEIKHYWIKISIYNFILIYVQEKFEPNALRYNISFINHWTLYKSYI